MGVVLGSDVEGSIGSLKVGSMILISWRLLLGSKEVLLALLLSFMLGLGGNLLVDAKSLGWWTSGDEFVGSL